jgi:shikimate 5-dehydrogenase
VFDAVYTPVWTQLLKDAKAAGCDVIDGQQMFVGQAADQFKIFIGTDVPVDLMTETLTAALEAQKK